MAEVALEVVAVTSLSRHEASLECAPFLLLVVVDYEFLGQSGCPSLLILVPEHLIHYHLSLVFPLHYGSVVGALLVLRLVVLEQIVVSHYVIFAELMVSVCQCLHPSLKLISQSYFSRHSVCIQHSIMSSFDLIKHGKYVIDRMI